MAAGANFTAIFVQSRQKSCKIVEYVSEAMKMMIFDVRDGFLIALRTGGPSQITGVRVGVATGTGTGASAAAAVGVCTCTAGKIEGGGNDESRPCPREPQRVDEGESVEPT